MKKKNLTMMLTIHKELISKIFSGEKTEEIRSSYPTQMLKEFGIMKAYLYETKCDGGCGMVVGECILSEVTPITQEVLHDKRYEKYRKYLTRHSCVEIPVLIRYACGKTIYALRISNTMRYDMPIPITDFRQTQYIRGYQRKTNVGFNKLFHANRVEVNYLNRAPQSWCYVEDLNNYYF